MIGLISYTTLALSAAASVSALVVPRMPKPPPAGWATDYLEPYQEYHARYIAIDCQHQHGTQFFADCCHPLLATEDLETARPPQCIPSSEALSDATETEDTVTDDSEEDYNSEEDDSTESEPTDSGEDHDSSPPPAALSTETEPTDSGEDHGNENHGNGGEPHGDNGDGGEPQGDGEPHVDAAPEGGKPSDEGSSQEGNTHNNNNQPSDGGDGGNPVGDASGLITGGFATFYEQGGVAGACGDFHSDSDFVAALDFRRYGDVDAQSPECGKTIHITNDNNGKSVDVLVVDACPTCVNENCIDLSPAAFNTIAEPVEGMVPISWTFTS